MVRIRLLTTLASPDGIKFAGHEIEVTEEQAAPLIATGQWIRVEPPADPEAGPRDARPKSDAPAEAENPPAKGGKLKFRREFRGK